MKNLIVIEGKEKYQFDNFEELIQKFISADYFSNSEDEKYNLLEIKSFANTMMDNINIIRLKRFPEDFNEESFIVYDEVSYILSMLKFNKFILLEKTDSNIFGKYIEKSNIEENYIIVNKFASEILKKYLKKEFDGNVEI